MIAMLRAVRDRAIAWRAGRATGMQLADEAEAALKAWYRRNELELLGRRHVIGLFFAGVLVGAAVVGIIVLSIHVAKNH